MLCRVLEKLMASLCNEVRVVFVLGQIVEQSGPVAKTHQYHSPRPSKRYLVMGIEITDSQQVVFSAEFLDKKGQPAQVQSPVWSTDNTDVLALTPAPDGLSCLVQAVSPIGTGIVTLKADADLGDGETAILGTAKVVVKSGAAVTVELKPGTPEEQPETPVT